MWYLCQFSNNKIENLLQKICFHIYHFTKDNNTLTLSSSPPSVSLPLPESPSFLSHRRITVISLSPSSSDVSLSPSSSGISLSPSTSGDGIYSKSPRCRLLYVIHNLQVKKPYLWMLSKGDKYTVRSLYDLLKKKARTMTRLERLSIGITIITEGNYDSLSKLAWVPMLGKTLGKPCQETSSADPLCLHWDSTRAPKITEVLEVEKKNNVSVVTTIDKERETSKINEGQTLKEEEEEQMEADTEVEEPVQVERQKRGRGNKEQEHKKNEEKRKDEAYEKAKEKFQDEDGSKLDKLIQMLYDLNKRVEVIENVLGVVPNGYESPCNYDDTKGAPNDENEEEENSGGKRNATDDENDDEEISDTQQMTERLKKMTSSTPTFTTPNFDRNV
uniref:Uncharacterized protein n=1 Tax=Brassica oleracea TaxID=3712 RepID=A0A3P6B1T3_BRAOL|nr:unnamed protein product [Brassica oleracea]